MKQLILGHLNTNRKIFTVTVFFFSRKNKKNAPKRPILVCLVYKEFSAISRQFPIISEDFFSRKNKKNAPKRPILVCLVYKEFSAISRQFPIISEDFRRLPKDFRRLMKMTKLCYGPFEQRLKKKFMSDFRADKNWQC